MKNELIPRGATVRGLLQPKVLKTLICLLFSMSVLGTSKE
jgi:hypothetical protein